MARRSPIAPKQHFTWQIGDGAALARAIGLKVVSDPRIADVKAGGQVLLVLIYHAGARRMSSEAARRA